MLKSRIHKDDIAYEDLGKIVLPTSDKTENFEIKKDPRSPAFIRRKGRWLHTNRNSWNGNNHLLAVLRRVQIEDNGIFKKRIGITNGAGNNRLKNFEELPIKRAYEAASILYAQQVEQNKNKPKEKEHYRRNGIFVHKSLNNLSYEKMSEASIDETINIKETTNVPSSTKHELIITLLDKNKAILHEETVNTSIKNESIIYAFNIEELTSANKIETLSVAFVKTTINIEHEDVHLKEEETIDIINVREVVHFRPHSKYKGEYGFDWFRNGDTHLANEKKFSYILQDADKLDEIKKKYLRENAIKRDNNKKYFVPKLTVYPNTFVKLEIFRDKKNEEVLDKIKYTSSNPNVKVVNNGKNIGIKTKEFSASVFIEARLNDTLIGKLELLANNNRKVIDIIMVRIKLELNENDPKNGKILAGDNKALINSLAQAYIKAKIETFDGLFDLVSEEKIEPYLYTESDTKIKRIKSYVDLNEFFEPMFNEKYPEHKNKIKVFFIGENMKNTDNVRLLGLADSVHSTSVTIFKSGNSSLSHEVFHALGLYHVFDKHEYYQTKKWESKNIMDYGEGKYYSYSWQWKKLFASTLLRKEK